MSTVSERPLGLPIGSIRAILALIIVSSAVYTKIQGIAVPWLDSAAMVVVGIYFGYRYSAQTNGKPTNGSIIGEELMPLDRDGTAPAPGLLKEDD